MQRLLLNASVCLAVGAAGLALSGCPDDAPGGETGEGGENDAAGVADTGADVNSDVDLGLDGKTPGASALDGMSTDTDTTEPDIIDPTCGNFGEACTANDACCSGFCVETFDGFQCTELCVDECPQGFSCQVILNSYPDVVTACVPNNSKLCHECTIDLQCNGGKCVEIGDANYCTVDCSKEPCPDGYECVTSDAGAQSCMPLNGSCDCDAENDGAVRPCARNNNFGICNGVETCNPAVGWSNCDAAEPAEDICDGLDNDCDGLADEDHQEAKPCVAQSEIGVCEGVETCQGSAGWVCSADVPTDEACDFIDNDCDGQTDEDFKNGAGKYTALAHCGGCNKNCEGVFPNGTAACDASGAVPQCVVASCAPGYYKSGSFQCLPLLDTACQPCTADFQCGGGVCVTVGGSSHCADSCNEDATCPTGYTCLASQAPDGTPKGQACLPKSNDCGCTVETQGQKRPCTSTTELGTCFGFEVCDATTGWSTCDAATPSPEICNGKDDDCNGLVDDALPAAQPCENSVAGVGTCTGQSTCQGLAGWVCSAPSPIPELCDFKDNDCDGETDEIFKNAAGKYALDQHCGTCNSNCAGAIPNATATCNDSAATPLCTVSSCNDGYYQVNDYLCLKEGESFCKLCQTDAQCDGKECVTIGTGNYCTDACTGDGDCPDGYGCVEAQDPDTGTTGQFCVPQNGSCDCNTDTAGAKRPCEVANDVGTCVGFEQCAPESGWGSCSATPATGELCDGIDNDCNGLIDDGLPPTQACENTNDAGTCTGTASCFGAQGWICNADQPSEDVCDFKDNDCDGAADEDFKNEAGKYASYEHCGSCNLPCGNIANAASEICDDSKPNPQCIVDECEPGYYRLNDFQCIKQPDVSCVACLTDADCFGGACVALSDGNFCAEPCQTDEECPGGFACDGANCQPLSGSCDCTEATAGVKKLCAVENDLGTCVGFSTCNPQQGWSSCDADAPAEEVCDGIDNDCNGIPDDGLPASQACANTNEFGTCNGTAACQGSAGWVCTAKTPTQEVCDFVDNDCDGTADDGFVNAAGKYASTEHCGTCNKACGNVVANSATEVCDTSKTVPQCIATACEPGYFLQNELQCIPNPQVACSPCVADDTCFGGTCTQVGAGTFCLQDCGPGGTCPNGYTCSGGLCEPQNGSCDCSEATSGAKRSCQVANDVGTCIGLETCVPSVGWTNCTASAAVEEVCDGADNDCNGLIDDDLPATQSCFNKNVYGICQGQAQCYGASGWVCLAPEPAPESCDFKDNDCDGETDEDYKDAAGKYTTLTHCGTCGNACGSQIPNSAVEICDASGVVPQCIVAECADGFIKLNDFQCIEVPEVACEPCSTDANCFGNTCAQVDTGTFCLTECIPGEVDCPSGYTCVDSLCRPNNGTCDCRPETDGAKRTCTAVGNLGTCFGFETCDPATGWGECDAEPPTEEVCNGQDDDCNGFIDDGLPATQACSSTPNQWGSCDGIASCFGTVGWFCTAPLAQEEICDYKDNDCDSVIDEGFKNSDGQYASQQHCGGCGISCDGAILNATAVCDSSSGVPQCVVQDCDNGWSKYNDFLCIPLTSTLCEPCVTDENCVAAGSKCVPLNDGFACGLACDDDLDCSDGYHCIDVGIGDTQCVPVTGSCDCDGTNLNLQKGCEVTNTPPGGGPQQTCFGTNYCTAGGWSGCELGGETCNGLDDNCNGLIDEDFKDGSGKLTSNEHCGVCNRNCAQLTFFNGVGTCDASLAVPDCTLTCLDGFFDTNDNPGDGCECEWESVVDHPDGTDHNCDGIDGQIEVGVFVSKSGSDTNPGTIESPKLTIQAAIDAAAAGSARDVYVATGVYSQSIRLEPGVSVYGGYSADFLARNIITYETAIIGQAPTTQRPGAVNAIGITGSGPSNNFDGFTVFGVDNQSGGGSSYAIYVRNSSARVRLTNNRVLAGSGGNGQSGVKGSDGSGGNPGQNGLDSADIGDCETGDLINNGGNGGTNSCGSVTTAGGRGGHGFCPDYNTAAQSAQENGAAGANGGGSGGGQGYDGIISPVGGTGGADNGPGCAGICGDGDPSPNGCFCDELCEVWGDCCNDACELCGLGCNGGSGEPGGSGCSIGNGCGSCIIPPDNLPMTGADGVNGPGGGPGAGGQGCSMTAGSVQNGLWVPASGTSGTSGSHGGGGGGGGAGNGVQTCSCEDYGGNDVGGTGGGGGAGGCGAVQGSQGGGGGGSFGIFVVFDNNPSSVPTISGNAIQRGVGGFGGPGGNGGVGGEGGNGGKGGVAGTGASETFCAGEGGDGGKGGNGGHGGGGGGGCGGASYGIFVSGEGSADLSTWAADNPAIPGGGGGPGGAGGLSLGNSGGQGSDGVFQFTNF